MSYYASETFLTRPLWNNHIDFLERKKIWSDCILRIPSMISWTLDEVRLVLQSSTPSYEYLSNREKLVSACGLQHIVHISYRDTLPVFVMDNHNHAFYCWYLSYKRYKTPRWSHLIHIDQHSDLNTANTDTKLSPHSSLADVAQYTNEVLDIGSFIQPAKRYWLISDYSMVLTEYSLLNFACSSPTLLAKEGIILDIDLDFWAPEMSITHYEQTIQRVRKILALPQVRCVTIATSPTYIDQKRALEILRDILE